MNSEPNERPMIGNDLPDFPTILPDGGAVPSWVRMATWALCDSIGAWPRQAARALAERIILLGIAEDAPDLLPHLAKEAAGLVRWFQSRRPEETGEIVRAIDKELAKDGAEAIMGAIQTDDAARTCASITEHRMAVLGMFAGIN